MTSLVSRIFPTATNMIRLDHTHVMSTYHQYKPSASARVKKGLVNTICTALEIHAQLEEEIFYPEVRKVTEDERINKSMEEHAEMRRLIGLLRAMEPEARDYDETLAALMRDVMHHVADEETIVLPAAEKLLADRLGDLGAQMTKRRLQLVGPRSGEIAVDMGRAASGNTAAIAVVGLAAAGLLVARRTGHLRWPARA
jgi:hemerythrin superfamily protein